MDTHSSAPLSTPAYRPAPMPVPAPAAARPPARIVRGRTLLSASRSALGHRLDELKSALQKAIRVGDLPMAYYCVLEIASFRDLATTSPEHAEAAQKILSNLLNRLAVIVAEDVGLAAPDLPAQVAPLLACGSVGWPQGPAGSQRLLKVVRLLAQAPKARLLSDLGLYWRPAKAEWAIAQPELAALFTVSGTNLRWDAPITDLLQQTRQRRGAAGEFDERLARIRHSLGDSWHGMEFEAKRLLCFMEFRSPLAFYWCSRDFVCHQQTKRLVPPLQQSLNGSSGGSSGGAKHKRFKVIYLAWALMEAWCLAWISPPSESDAGEGAAKDRSGRADQFHKANLDQIRALQRLYESRASHSEAPLFLFHAMAYCVVRSDLIRAARQVHQALDAARHNLVALDPSTSAGGGGSDWGQSGADILAEHGRRTAPLALPAHAMDKHTKRGRDQGWDTADFVMVGAQVAAERREIISPVLRRLYQLLGTVLADGSRRIEFHPWNQEGPVARWPVYKPLASLPASELNQLFLVGNSSSSSESDTGPENKRYKKRPKANPAPAIPTGPPAVAAATTTSMDIKLEPGFEDLCKSMAPLPTQPSPRQAPAPVPGPVLTEAQCFAHCQRVQVLTAKHRPDCYYAWGTPPGPWCGLPLFVKGPYVGEGARAMLRFQVGHNRLKERFEGLTPVPHMGMALLVPCLDPGFFGAHSDNPPGFGSRTKARPGQACGFLVARDVMAPQRREPYPAKPYGKLTSSWSAATMLANPAAMPFLAVCTHGSPLQLASRGTVADWRAYLLALLFNYVCDITDSCVRNLLWNPQQHCVYSVDEESSGERVGRSTLFKKPLGQKQRAAMEQIVKACWPEILQTELAQWSAVLAKDPSLPRLTRENVTLLCGMDVAALCRLL